MNLWENDYKITYEKDRFFDFEERVLESGLCDFSIPMHFIHDRNNITAVYECSGYTALADLKWTSASMCLEVLSKLLRSLYKVDDFLIDYNKMRLNLDTIFFHRRYRNVRIAYCPEKHRPIQTKVDDLILQMEKSLSLSVEQSAKTDGSRSWVNHAVRLLEEARKTIRMDNLSLQHAADLVDRMRREEYSYQVH